MVIVARPLPLDPTLIREAEGWSLWPTALLLLGQSGGFDDMVALVGSIVRSLREAGAPLSRFRLSTMTLHPLVTSWGARWAGGDSVEPMEFPHDRVHSDEYVGSPAQHVRETGTPFRRRLEGPLTMDDHRLLHELKEAGATDYYATPLSRREREGGFITVSTDRAGGFSDLDIAKFDALSLMVAPHAHSLNRYRIATSLLETYVGRRGSARVLHGNVRRGDYEHITAALWYSDLRDFTRMSEELESDQMLDLLNTYFSAVSKAVIDRGGDILQFIGDAVLAVFPCAADPDSTASACEAAFDAALASLAEIAEVNKTRAAAGLPEIHFGIGLHIGEVAFGNVGAVDRLSFNVIGPAVNLTARLESLTKQAMVPLLLSHPLAEVINRALSPVGSFQLKGIRELQAVFTAADLVQK